MTHTVLVVDDEKDILDSLERQLRKDYRVLKASSGIDALQLLNKEDVHLIISDQRMPEMTGVQLFERAQKVRPDCIRILLTGFTDVESVIAAVNNGQIYRYVTKPWDPTELGVIVKRALDAFDLKSELKIKNQLLEKALEDLKVLDQAKSHFMILISHELKTPLTTITSFTDLLLEEKLNPDSKKYVERIKTGVEKLNSLIFDVLDIMKAQTGQIKLSPQDLSLKTFVDDQTKPHLTVAQKRKVKLTCNAPEDVVRLDFSLLSKVTSELIQNAVGFSDENSTVAVELKRTDGRIRFEVSNHGPTIPKERLKRLTEPFYLDENILHHSQGTGLGLTVAVSLLKVFGSELHLESSGGKTKAWFEIRTA
ncbi:MAG: hybrid sensor histidine kinase/response regulator [Oligoflexia bacterium]|nr:hybrid sensor histidine kinase/response regulator [Oligoflexia bacterium]